jgi:dTMP kinase
MHPSSLIVFEGPDGSGTTTHSRLLAEKLRSEGKDVLLTCEPTSGPIGQFIRGELSKATIDSPTALQLLFTADRAWHSDTVINPALNAGKTVITDRFSLSTLLYGEALGIDRDWLESMNKKFDQKSTMILCLPPFETCMERMEKREFQDVLEKRDFQRKVYDLYQKYSEDYQIDVIDTAGEKEEVSRKIWEKFLESEK